MSRKINDMMWYKQRILWYKRQYLSPGARRIRRAVFRALGKNCLDLPCCTFHLIKTGVNFELGYDFYSVACIFPPLKIREAKMDGDNIILCNAREKRIPHLVVPFKTSHQVFEWRALREAVKKFLARTEWIQGLQTYH